MPSKSRQGSSLEMKAFQRTPLVQLLRQAMGGSNISWCGEDSPSDDGPAFHKTRLHTEKKLVEFQRYMTNVRTAYNYPLSYIGNAGETPVFIDVPHATTVCDKGSKDVLIITSGNRENPKFRIALFADSQ